MELGIANPLAALRLNMNQMLDGYGWKPLSNDFDFVATLEEAKSELLESNLVNNA